MSVKVSNNNTQISILTSVVIAALVFAIAALALAMYATIRLVIIGPRSGSGQGGIYPGGMSAGGSSTVKGGKGGSGEGSGAFTRDSSMI